MPITLHASRARTEFSGCCENGNINVYKGATIRFLTRIDKANGINPQSRSKSLNNIQRDKRTLEKASLWYNSEYTRASCLLTLRLYVISCIFFKKR